MNRSLATSKKSMTIKQALEQHKETLFAAMPSHMDADRMIRITMTALRANPRLLECSQESLFKCIVQCSQLGLEPDGVLGLAYLIPYGREATLVVGYKGLLMLARRSGELLSITCEEVYSCDEFEYQLGDDARIEHVPSDDADRESHPITHVYASVEMTGGSRQRKVWSRKKIDRHKERFSSGWRRAHDKKQDSPWHHDWVSMAKKTVLRDMINRGEIPLSVEVRSIAAREEAVEIEAQQAAAPADVVSSLDMLADRLEDGANSDSTDMLTDGKVESEV